YIRAGGFPHVAAVAAGVPREVFEAWMVMGGRQPARSNGPYIAFRKAVEQAMAQARLTAEIEVFKQDPVTWLKSGPGEETGTDPGWTAQTKPVVREGNRTINVLLTPEMQGVFAALLQVLAPYPEARVAVAEALAGGARKRLDDKAAPKELP